MKPHYHVVIATPGRQFHAEYVNSLVETTRWLSSKGLDYKLLNTYSSFVPSARELTATNSGVHNWETNEIGGGEFTYDKIFWIDSDISWDVEDFVRILESKLEIVSGLYQTDIYGTVAVNFPDNEGRPTKVNKVEFIMFDEPVEVGGVGFGFVAMEQGVFEGLPRPWFGIKKIKWPEHDFLTNIGEDYSWCYSATLSGLHIWVDPTVKVRHHKETIYEV
jgi:hypothetical protein